MTVTLYWLNLFLVFVRVLSVLMTAPLFSNRSVPAPVKIGFAALLSFLILPLPDARPVAVPTELLPFALTVAQEVLIGVVIGFVSNLIFMGVGIAASMIGIQSGFRAASLFNPFTNVSTSALDQFYSLIAIALFLAIDGHHMLIRALFRTFELVPIGTFVISGVTVERIVALTNQMFVIGVTLSLPVVGTLLLTDVGLGLIARAVPQIQVFFVGLPLKVGLGFVTLALTMNITLPVIRDYFSDIAVTVLAVIAQ
ncbi:MAG: flagellar biosynthetic protein FliR [Anaerolineae bacterium]